MSEQTLAWLNVCICWGAVLFVLMGLPWLWDKLKYWEFTVEMESPNVGVFEYRSIWSKTWEGVTYRCLDVICPFTDVMVWERIDGDFFTFEEAKPDPFVRQKLDEARERYTTP